jgi:hypothetical protein
MLIFNSIETADEMLIHSLNSKIFDTYGAKINLLFNLLYSTETLPINTMKSIMHFFNIISPLNNEFNMGSYKWNFKTVENRLYVQNSITKHDLNDYVKLKYLNPLNKVLTISNLTFDYYQIKSSRFYKNVDIIFVFEI